MNQAMWMSLVRSAGIFFGGMLVSRGLLSATALTNLIDKIVEAIPTVTNFVAAMTPLALAVWGVFRHTDKTKIKEVDAMPDVGKIIPKPGADPNSAIVQAAADPALPKVAVS